MADEKGEKRHLAPVIRLFWAAQATVSIIFLALLLNYLLSSLKQDILWIGHGEIGLYISGLALMILMPYFIYTELRYRNHFYILAKDEIIIRSGVFNTERTLIPYVKIQNMNISRSVLERLVGAATLRIETAGGNPGEAEGILPSMWDYEKVSSELLEKIEAARRKGQKGGF